jgi:hypothetical protein
MVETKAGAVLQLCLYSDLLAADPGSPTRVYVCGRALVGLSAARLPLCRLRRLFPEGTPLTNPRLLGFIVIRLFL